MSILTRLWSISFRTDNSLVVKALAIATQAGNLSFKASNGYFQKFKKRHFITFVKSHLDADAVPSQVIVEWKES